MRKLIVLFALALIGANRGYALKELPLPAGYSFGRLDGAGARRPPFVLAENGMTAALAVRGTQRLGANRIIVWRRDGTRVALKLPSPSLLLHSFRQYSEDAGGHPQFPDAFFENVVLAPDGTPFATVANPFSGAYSGQGSAVFRWGSAGWTPVADYRLSPQDGPPDYTIEAAASAERLLLTADYTSSFIILDAQQRDPSYQLAEAYVLDGHRLIHLGDGTATAMAGAFVSGYFGTMGGKTMPDNLDRDGQQAHAVYWFGSHRKVLGSGIAFGINSRGISVGDNRDGLTGGTYTVVRGPTGTAVTAQNGVPDGSPVIWDAGFEHVVSSRRGTAYAISTNGTIVGAFEPSGGFIYRRGKLTNLDVLGAYAVNDRGDILVRTNGGSLALLHF